MKKIKFGETTKLLLTEEETLFNQGDEGDKAYMIISGRLTVLVDNVRVGSMSDGEVFGELALLDEEPRSASAVCSEPSRLIGFFRSDLLTLIKRYPELGNKILLNLSRVLGERLRETNKNIIKSK